MKKINILSIIFLLNLFLQACNAQETKGVKNIDQKEFVALAKDKKTVIIDVRTKQEIVSEGYIKGTTLFIDYNSPDFEQQIAKLDQSKSYLVYCKSGGRSSGATGIMAKKGFKSVYNLKGGFSNWSGPTQK